MSNNPIATITMENGAEIKIELRPDAAPITVENFVDLIKSRPPVTLTVIGKGGMHVRDILPGCSLSVPNDLKFLPVILDYTRGFARLAGFEEREQLQIELAAEEAVTNVIEHAFLPGQRAMFEIKCEIQATALMITVCDQGLPFDPARIDEYDAAKSLKSGDTSGLGNRLMNSLMDRIEYHNLGVKGKETRLIKNFPAVLIAREGGEKTSSERDPVVQVKEDLGELEIRLMKPEEAIEVSRCFFEAYGYSYMNENIYYPERIAALNQSGDIISAVAVNQKGEVISHAALIFDPELPGLAEMGMAATRPRFQGSGVIAKLDPLLAAEGAKRSISGFISHAVTMHSYSQRIIWRNGYRETGFLLSALPESVSLRGIADKAASRGSGVIMFMRTAPVGEPETVFPPAVHREMIAGIYRNLKTKTTLGEGEDPRALAGSTLMESSISYGRGAATINFHSYGRDIFDQVRILIYRVKREKLYVIDLYLNLKDPLTPYVAERLQEMGFNFTGIVPATERGDLLIMQYYNGVAVDYDGVRVYSDFARELLAYIRSCDPLEMRV